jgi:hypothetical protein
MDEWRRYRARRYPLVGVWLRDDSPQLGLEFRLGAGLYVMVEVEPSRAVLAYLAEQGYIAVRDGERMLEVQEGLT